MNINLNTGEGNFGETMETPQEEIEEHIEILRGAAVRCSGEVMLIADREYRGVYRVWHRILPPEGTIESAHQNVWGWVSPDGELVTSLWPWAVD